MDRRGNAGRLRLSGFVGVASLIGVVSVSIGGASAQQPATSTSAVTFAKDVAPIFQRSCQNCHRPGSVAPMSLISYEDARPWARAIKTRVSKREMPPWGIDKNVGIQEFKDDISLTDEELATVVKWVDTGAPMGNPADMPKALAFSDDRPWHIGNGKPDLIVSMPRPFKVPAVGADVTLEFLAETGLTEDRYLKAIETKPDPKSIKVVHHASLDLVEPGAGLDASRENYGMGGARSFLSEYALGKDADIFPPDTGRLVKAGSKVNFNMHYYSTGEEVESTTSVGMVFYPKGYVPKHVVITQHIGENADLDIPGGTIGRVDGYTTLSQNAQLVMIQPHMHSRGKRQCTEAILPATTGEVSRGNGSKTERITLNCINFDMNWNIAYKYADAAAPVLPKGTVIHITSWYDNTVSKFNPDSKNWVGNGPRSVDIMSYQWQSFFYLSDEEYAQKIAQRKAKAQSTNQQ
jgi:mono/diheme cytochrome c family protein